MLENERLVHLACHDVKVVNAVLCQWLETVCRGLQQASVTAVKRQKLFGLGTSRERPESLAASSSQNNGYKIHMNLGVRVDSQAAEYNI